jgi:hypothetical protein
MVPMNRVGFSEKALQVLPLLVPCFLFSSMDSLLAETNAISKPDRNPINSKEANMASIAIQSMV